MIWMDGVPTIHLSARYFAPGAMKQTVKQWAFRNCETTATKQCIQFSLRSAGLLFDKETKEF
jgi:hypothetical protein